MSAASRFAQNCARLLATDQGNQLSSRLLEFVNGGDEFYRAREVISPQEWQALSIADQVALAEAELDRPTLRLRYPGTFSGPSSEDLYMLQGLDRIEDLTIDSMLVTTYRALLDLNSLRRLKVDIFGHTEGLAKGEWRVFDALISALSLNEPADFQIVIKDLRQWKGRLALDLEFMKIQATGVPLASSTPALGPLDQRGRPLDWTVERLLRDFPAG